MRIVCPACAAAYQVPDESLAPGRVVRCARCETDWVPLPELDPVPPPEVEPAVTEPEVEAEAPAIIEAEEPPPALQIDVTERPAPAAEPPNRALQLAWAGSIVVVIAALAGAMMARDGVMRAWPPSVRAYAALGLATRPAPASH